MSKRRYPGLKTWAGAYETGASQRIKRLLSRRPRRGQWRNYNTTRAKASRALTLIRKFQKEEELKQIDISGSATLAYGSSDTWQAAGRILLNPCTQGTTAETRIGKKITMKDLLLRLKFTRASTDTGGVLFRIVIFYDRKPAGAVPSATSIFDTDSFLAPLQRNNSGRFAILHDQNISLDNETFFYPLKIYVNLTRVGKVDYGLGNAGTVADISKGALYIWVNGSSLDVADSAFAYNSRVKFTDA